MGCSFRARSNRYRYTDDLETHLQTCTLSRSVNTKISRNLRIPLVVQPSTRFDFFFFKLLFPILEKARVLHRAGRILADRERVSVDLTRRHFPLRGTPRSPLLRKPGEKCVARESRDSRETSLYVYIARYIARSGVGAGETRAVMVLRALFYERVPWGVGTTDLPG